MRARAAETGSCRWILPGCLLLAGAIPLAADPAPGLLADLLTGAGRPAAIERIAEARDRRFLAPLIDLLGLTKNASEYQALLAAIETIGAPGVEPGKGAWEKLMLWYGGQSGQAVPPGYLEWKGELFARAADPRFREFFRPPATLRPEGIVWGGVAALDGIPPLIDSPLGGGDYLTGAEPVFGVSLNGDHRAYPLRILDAHEMANDVVGGVPVALAYCTLCGAGVLYRAERGGRRVIFGSSGLLYESNKLMFDRETKSLWNQLTGEPVLGTLAGGPALARLPLVLTSWGQWKRRHPETKVLGLDTGYARRYEPGAVYGEYFASPGTMFPVWRRSKLLPLKARVFALVVNGEAKAYPLEGLPEVVNDEVGGEPLVVVAEGRGAEFPEPWRSVVKAARPADLKAAAFRQALKRNPALADTAAGVLAAMPLAERQTAFGGVPQKLRDEAAVRALTGEVRAYRRGSVRFREGLADEAGVTWTLTEEALVSPAGERLARLPGHVAYWFGWFSFYPQTKVFRAAPAR